MKVTRTKDYYKILEDCFSTDNDLIEKWHIVSGEGLKSCVDRTYKDLNRCDKSFKFFKLEENNKLFGYFGTESIDSINFLTGFFVMPEFRNKEGFGSFWKEVKKNFNNEKFYVGIHSKNLRAANFLEKSGAKKHIEIKNDKVQGTVFVFNVGV